MASLEKEKTPSMRRPFCPEIGHLGHSTNHEAAKRQSKSRRKEELVLDLYFNKGKELPRNSKRGWSPNMDC